MPTFPIVERTDPDGTLTLRIPLGQPDTEFRVLVIIRPKAAQVNPWAAVDAIRNALPATGRQFGDSVQDIREDRDR
ncbi:MAG: hypothetical protein JO112_05135 [Planctomycetes bacterium]|nr:hypothetical protein [Planctomycetota bacterium]